MRRRVIAHANADGSCAFENVSGWEGYRLSGRAAIVNGRPAMIALAVEPLDDSPPIALTGARLRAIPLVELATLALAATHTRRPAGDLRAAMRAVARAEAVKHDARAVVTVEQVAGVWRLAHDTGQPPRAAVMAQLSIGARTADRYIARARDSGLIPPSPRTPPRPAGKRNDTRKAEQ